MRDLSRAVRQLDRGGTALPLPFRSWANAQIHIRRGEVTLIAGPPGVGKSTVALALAMGMPEVPTLYFSCDSHAATMALRSLSMLTGIPQGNVEERMSDDPAWASSVLRQSSHIKWVFDSSPTLADIEDEISIYRLVQGQDPHLIVIDNAADVGYESGDEFSSLRQLMKEVKFWARETNAALVVLHHTSEGYSGEPCPPRSAIHGKISQTPASVLTLAAPQPGYMAVAAVKNRYGPADASGRTAIWMDYAPTTMHLADMEHGAA